MRASSPSCVDGLAWPLQGRKRRKGGRKCANWRNSDCASPRWRCRPALRRRSVADFYKGKTVTIIVGYTAGGGYDLYARALARHMGRHLPGNPNFIVQNITGAGSVNAANNLYNVAAKDGTVFGTFGRGLAHGAADRHRARAIRRHQVHLARQRHQRGFAVRDLAHVAGEDLAGCAEDAASRSAAKAPAPIPTPLPRWCATCSASS